MQDATATDKEEVDGMNKFKGTPRPWLIHELVMGVSVRGANGEAVFYESDKRIPGVIADANLIAAAPELLEVLMEIINGGGKFVMTADIHRKARSTIAKALGEDHG